MVGKENKIFSATTCYGRNGKRYSSTGRAFWAIGEAREYGKAEHMWDRATLGRAWFLSPLSWFLCRIPELSRKQQRVNPGNSDAWYGVLLHHEFGKGKSKRRNTGVKLAVRGNRNSRREGESGCMYVCGMLGVQNTRRRTGKWNFYTLDRFSADGFRTRATRVILWRVLGVRAAKGETEKKRA